MTLSGASLTMPRQAWVLLTGGSPAAVAGLQAQVAPRLAAALDLPLLEPLDPLAPDRALSTLAEAGAGLTPLHRDPGHGLDDGRHWAEVLGAWRQPVVVVLTAEQLETGLAAALVALLQQWQTPCVGLVQWGGSWDPEQRRRDRLPWLGRLPGLGQLPPEQDRDAGLALRWGAGARWSLWQG